MPELAPAAPAMVLSDREFKQISQLAHERFGLELKPGKEALVAARLGKRLRQRGFQSFADYYRHVLSDASGEALTELIDALTTNHTSFLRERAHFEFLAQAVVGEFGSARTVEIWSAACSSGEEPHFDCHVRLGCIESRQIRHASAPYSGHRYFHSCACDGPARCVPGRTVPRVT